MAQTSISIRMDAELKKNFETFCGAVGMNMSTAINMFAIACVREQRVPRSVHCRASRSISLRIRRGATGKTEHLREYIARMIAAAMR